MSTVDETVTLTRAEYLRLMEDSFVLEQMRMAGVDNWQGMDAVDFGAVEDAMAGVRAVVGE